MRYRHETIFKCLVAFSTEQIPYQPLETYNCFLYLQATTFRVLIQRLADQSFETTDPVLPIPR